MAAKNVAAELGAGGAVRHFRYKTQGAFVDMGRYEAVASTMGSDGAASRRGSSPVPTTFALMPGIKRKYRLLVDWNVDLLFARDTSELGQLGHPPALAGEPLAEQSGGGTGEGPGGRMLRGGLTDVLDQVKRDVTSALKAGDKERVGALRLVLSELQKAEKEGSDDAQAVLRRERKRRLDAAGQFRDAGREELAAGEEAEAELIQGYLPAELSDDELRDLVEVGVAESGAASMKDMGRAMGAIMPRVAGRADGKRVQGLVREKLDPPTHA